MTSVGTLDWTHFKNFLRPSANPLLVQMAYLIVGTALQEALGPSFSSPLNRLFLQGAALPAGFGASRTVFIPTSHEIDAKGLIIRSPETLRPLTLCNCDCKVLTASMCSGLGRYSIECIQPSQRCVTQRSMTDNIFEIETAAVALRTGYCEDPGILLTDFSCTYPSVDHRWIFLVLELAGILSVVFTMILSPPLSMLGCTWAVRDDERSTSKLPSEWLLVHRGF